MIKCLLIYLWIYIGLFSMIDAGDNDEHVHIKLHMTSGQRKRAQTQQHTHQHHKKRHIASSSYPDHHHHHHHLHHHPRHHRHAQAPTTSNLYQDSLHNYLTGITATSSPSLFPQNHVFQPAHTKKFPSSSPLNFHESSGHLLNMDEEVFGQDVGGGDLVTVDANAGDPMIIPSYMTKNFASFPQPTATYETEIIPHNSGGFNMASDGLDGLNELDGIAEDNEITAAAAGRARGRGEGKGKGSLGSIILDEQMQNYHRHKPPSSLSSASSKTAKTEQLLQQLLQQQHNNEQLEIANAAAFKSAKLRSNKNKADKHYNSENDMTDSMMYSSSATDPTQNSAQSSRRPAEDVYYSGGSKVLSVDDIWSQLQQEYLSKYAPQAQPLTPADSDEEQLFSTTPIRAKQKRKRNTKRQRHAKPTTTTSNWPPKSLSHSANKHHSKHHLQPIKQQKHYYDDTHSPSSAAAFGTPSSMSSHWDTDFFLKSPLSQLNTHSEEDDTAEADEDAFAEQQHELGEDDEIDVDSDESSEESVYQRGKKFARHSAYGHHRHTNNPFNNPHDLYGSFSTPITATVATNIQPSTYHPKLLSSTLPSFTSSSSANTFLPTVSRPSTSYLWHTQQDYPSSYQTYHVQHQQQQPQWTAEQYDELQSSTALDSPKATLMQTQNAGTSSKLSPTQSNEFTQPSSPLSSSSSFSSSAQGAVQSPARYKKRKNRIKPKRNRILVV